MKMQLGLPLILTKGELDKLSEITQVDIVRVNDRWTKVATQWAKNILVTEKKDG